MVFLCVKFACEVFAHFEIFDVHAERLSTACSRVSFAFPNGIGELNACANPRFDDDNDERPLPPLPSCTAAVTAATAAKAVATSSSYM